MKNLWISVLWLLASLYAAAQTAPAASAASAASSQQSAPEISGMYSFLQEGEFLELDLDEQNVLTGYVSRLGDGTSDRGAVLDHLIDKGELQGNHLHFVTKTIHGVWFEFKGTVERGEAKDETKEGYRVLRGTLWQYTSDENKKTSAKSREVTFKSFPQDALDQPANKASKKD